MNKSKNINKVILGIGNILLGDEGVGIHAVDRLMKMDLPPDILVVDGSTAGFRLFPIFKDYKECEFIIIDSIRIPPEKPRSKTREVKKGPGKGDLYLIPIKEFYNVAKSKYLSNEFVSFHQTALIDVLNLFYLTYRIRTKGKLLGVNISEDRSLDGLHTLSTEMSEEIENKIPDIIKMVLKQIQHESKSPTYK